MVKFDQKNMNGVCSNLLCGFRFRNITTKANFYHTSEKSWVCTTCAQAINREHFAKTNRYSAKYVPVCISSEEELLHRLQGMTA